MSFSHQRGCLPLTLCLLGSVASAQTEILEDATIDAGSSVVAESDFGQSLATEEQWLAVGAPQDAISLLGEVQLFQRIGGTVFTSVGSFDGPSPGGAYGAAVDLDLISGVPRVLVGAPETDQPSQPRAGVAQLLELQGGGLVPIATFQVPTPVAQSMLGASVGFDGDLAVVGRPGTGAGDVRVWDGSGGGFQPLSPIVAFDGGTGDEFGKALALDGSVLAVGAPSHDLGGATADGGAVYLYAQTSPQGPLNPLGLLLDSKLTAPSPQAFDEFGAAVALEGELLAVGAPGRGPSGEVLLFRRQGNTFLLEDTLAPAGLSPNARYGASVAIVDGRVHVGAPLAVPPGGASQNGIAFIHRELAPGSGVWEVLFQLLAANDSGGDRVGTAIGAIGEFALAGAPRASAPTNPLNPGTPVLNAGVVYAFDAGDQVCITDFVGTTTPGVTDRYGATLSLQGDTLLVGRPDDDASTTDGGSVSVLRLDGGDWTEEQVLEPQSRALEGQFGHSIALEGDRLAVGSPAVDGSPFQSGFVEVWSRPGPAAAFAREIVLTDEDSAPGDRFGASVAIREDSVLVGVPGEGLEKGRLAEFERDPVIGWRPRQTVRHTDDISIDPAFGSAVAVTEQYAVVGAPGADLALDDAGDLTLLEYRDAVLRSANRLDSSDPVIGSVLSISNGFGQLPMALVGDYGQNGIPDLALGGPGSLAGNGAGALLLINLDDQGNAVSIRTIDSVSAPTLGLQPGDNFGGGVVYGQFDGDADLEIAVGAYRYAGDGVGDAGAVYLLDLDASGNVVGFRRISSAVITALSTGEWFGFSLANLGDLDGNGVEDLAVGAPDLGAGTNIGFVYTILLGPPVDPVLANVLSSKKCSTGDTGEPAVVDLGFGGVDGDRFGRVMEVIGDVDADGHPELLVGSSATQVGGVQKGAGFVVEVTADPDPLVAGSVAPLSMIASGMSGIPDVIVGTGGLGQGVAVFGDLDGDGLPTIALSDNLDAETYFDFEKAGALWLGEVLPDGALVDVERWSGTESNFSQLQFDNSQLGRQLEWLGDFDGDGVSELALTRQSDGGALWIIETGPGWGLVDERVVSSQPNPFARLGTAVAIDGTTVLAGAPGSDLAGPLAGAVVVYRIIDDQLVEVQTILPEPESGPAAGLGFGTSVAIQGNRALIGASSGLDGTAGLGRAFLYERDDATSDFFFREEIEPGAAAQLGDAFGASVALDGATAFVGAPLRDAGGPDLGTIFSVSLSGSQCPELLASTDAVSVSQGGEQAFFFEVDPIYWDPAAAGFAPHLYLTLASTGLLPGPLPNGLTLFPDALFNLSLTGVNQAPFIDTFGSVAAPGVIESSFAFPAGTSPNLAGLRVFSSTVVFGFDLVVDEVSDVSSFEFVP